jgi:hypothetical protein
MNIGEVEERTCRVCERPSGIYEECDRCFLDRLEGQFDELVGIERVAEEPEPAEERPRSVPPPVQAASPPRPVPEPRPQASSRNPSRRAIAALAVAGGLAVVGSFAIFSSEDGDAPAAEPPLALTDPPADESGLTGLGEDPAAEILGTWSGRIEVRYDKGPSDQLNQTINIARLNEGGPAGFSRSTQNGGTCRGPLTFTGMSGGAYTFDYRELNTKQCIASGVVSLTPGANSEMVYKEVTDSTVNRGTLTRD